MRPVTHPPRPRSAARPTRAQVADAMQRVVHDPYADVGLAFAEETSSQRAFNLPTGDRKIVRTFPLGSNETATPKAADAAAGV